MVIDGKKIITLESNEKSLLMDTVYLIKNLVDAFGEDTSVADDFGLEDLCEGLQTLYYQDSFTVNYEGGRL